LHASLKRDGETVDPQRRGDSGQELGDCIAKSLRVLEQEAVPGPWVEDQLGMWKSLSHHIRVVGVDHDVVGAVRDQYRDGDLSKPRQGGSGTLGPFKDGDGLRGNAFQVYCRPTTLVMLVESGEMRDASIATIWGAQATAGLPILTPGGVVQRLVADLLEGCYPKATDRPDVSPAQGRADLRNLALAYLG
jgi:hypothetical protein